MTINVRGDDGRMMEGGNFASMYTAWRGGFVKGGFGRAVGDVSWILLRMLISGVSSTDFWEGNGVLMGHDGLMRLRFTVFVWGRTDGWAVGSGRQFEDCVRVWRSDNGRAEVRIGKSVAKMTG